jgi:hypothetical protein
MFFGSVFDADSEYDIHFDRKWNLVVKIAKYEPDF